MAFEVDVEAGANVLDFDFFDLVEAERVGTVGAAPPKPYKDWRAPSAAK